MKAAVKSGAEKEATPLERTRHNETVLFQLRWYDRGQVNHETCMVKMDRCLPPTRK